MHVEPGMVIAPKVAMANMAAVGVIGYYLRDWISVKDIKKSVLNLGRTALAALWFLLMMQFLPHFPVGPSEWHMVSFLIMYLIFGFTPTLYGFAISLAIQATPIFEPQDMVHLGVNFLSLAVPLIVVHNIYKSKVWKITTGDLSKNMTRDIKDGINYFDLVKIDTTYYVLMSLMVLFWLSWGGVLEHPAEGWLKFMSSYAINLVIEPLVTVVLVKTLLKFKDSYFINNYTTVKEIKCAC